MLVPSGLDACFVKWEAIYPKPNISRKGEVSRKYPYLLRGLAVDRPNHVWSTDITYIRLKQGFVYLVAIMDWFSRYVLSWEISNSLDSFFCLWALDRAFMKGMPEIFNSDQGSQFTNEAFTNRLETSGIRISWDGRGRAMDNIITLVGVTTSVCGVASNMRRCI